MQTNQEAQKGEMRRKGKDSSPGDALWASGGPGGLGPYVRPTEESSGGEEAGCLCFSSQPWPSGGSSQETVDDPFGQEKMVR